MNPCDALTLLRNNRRRSVPSRWRFMRTLDAIVLSSMQFFNHKIADRYSSQSGGAITSMWRLRIVYGRPGAVNEIELHEPLRSICAKRYTIGINGLCEFKMLSDPGISAGTRIRINAYEP